MSQYVTSLYRFIYFIAREKWPSAGSSGHQSNGTCSETARIHLLVKGCDPWSAVRRGRRGICSKKQVEGSK